MANAALFRVQEFFNGAVLATVVFSGTVNVDGNPAARTVIGYNSSKPDQPFETVSNASTGAWELEIKMGLAETARIFVVGNTGENSEIFEHLVE